MPRDYPDIALEPVNRLAAIVTGKGTSFSPQMKPNEAHFHTDVQPLLKKWAETSGEDLTGRIFGRCRVIGYSADFHGRWVVRCHCGHYEVRRARAINNPNNGVDMCYVCRASFFVTRGYTPQDMRQQPKAQRMKEEVL